MQEREIQEFGQEHRKVGEECDSCLMIGLTGPFFEVMGTQPPLQ